MVLAISLSFKQAHLSIALQMDQRLTTHPPTPSSYPIDVPFPHLDTSPHTLFSQNGPNLGICTALATSSETGTRLTDMARLVGRAIELDAREALLNDLAGLAEAYMEGYRSNSGSGEDE